MCYTNEKIQQEKKKEIIKVLLYLYIKIEYNNI